MTDKSKRILEEAFSLSDDEKIEVVEKLLNSVELSEDELIDEAWRNEIMRRSKEIELGTVKTLSWDEVKEMAYKRSRGDV